MLIARVQELRNEFGIVEGLDAPQSCTCADTAAQTQWVDNYEEILGKETAANATTQVQELSND